MQWEDVERWKTSCSWGAPKFESSILQDAAPKQSRASINASCNQNANRKLDHPVNHEDLRVSRGNEGTHSNVTRGRNAHGLHGSRGSAAVGRRRWRCEAPRRKRRRARKRSSKATNGGRGSEGFQGSSTTRKRQTQCQWWWRTPQESKWRWRRRWQ